MLKNMINWFEIPVSNMDRAKQFYETIFGFSLSEMKIPGFRYYAFPSDPSGEKVSGALVQGDAYKPASSGVLIYLNANPDLAQILKKIEAAGGDVIMPKTQISPEVGFWALFLDSEGNKLALHSNH